MANTNKRRLFQVYNDAVDRKKYTNHDTSHTTATSVDTRPSTRMHNLKFDTQFSEPQSLPCIKAHKKPRSIKNFSQANTEGNDDIKTKTPVFTSECDPTNVNSEEKKKYYYKRMPLQDITHLYRNDPKFSRSRPPLRRIATSPTILTVPESRPIPLRRRLSQPNIFNTKTDENNPKFYTTGEMSTATLLSGKKEGEKKDSVVIPHATKEIAQTSNDEEESKIVQCLEKPTCSVKSGLADQAQSLSQKNVKSSAEIEKHSQTRKSDALDTTNSGIVKGEEALVTSCAEKSTTAPTLAASPQAGLKSSVIISTLNSKHNSEGLKCGSKSKATLQPKQILVKSTNHPGTTVKVVNHPDLKTKYHCAAKTSATTSVFTSKSLTASRKLSKPPSSDANSRNAICMMR
ncbi:hypothetical protein BKA69DRAFT_1121135 [Paraphysoderma sedebokerense]|nr:hypothetical protein BKA69DRAFT_1121135 [Paraphysoderma sedebokerense]